MESIEVFEHARNDAAFADGIGSSTGASHSDGFVEWYKEGVVVRTLGM